jgi:hypothetical protein
VKIVQWVDIARGRVVIGDGESMFAFRDSMKKLAGQYEGSVKKR